MKDFGKYIIKKQIGIGGTASVYLAQHKGLDRDVILKVMSDNLFTHEINYRQLFVEEAQIIAKLNHPNIIQVYDVNISKERTYIEMEYLSGGTLKERINKNQGFEPVQVIREIAAALHYVFNTTGTIHRDIKPSNILFREEEKVLVAVLSDFGIAKTEDTNTEFTNIGVRVGTPRYMSPEQLMGGEVDQRSDLYSLGIILYEMLTEELFNREKTPDLAENFKIPKLPNEHKKSQPILNKLCAPNPNKRYANAGELVIALNKFNHYKLSKQNWNDNDLDETNVLTSTLAKITAHAEPVNKSNFIIYALVLAINLIGGAYVYFDATEKNEQKITDIEKLEVSLLSFEQSETDHKSITELLTSVQNKYPADSNIENISLEIQKISQKQRKRSLLSSTTKLIENKEYLLAEKQLSLVVKLNPSEIELDEINLILDIIKNKEEEVIKEKTAIKASESKSATIPFFHNNSSDIDKADKDNKAEEKVRTSPKKNVVEPTEITPRSSKLPSALNVLNDECHSHKVNAKTKSIKHCHPNPEGKHIYKNSPWEHTHAAIRNCTNSISHSHRFKGKNHQHRYSCTTKSK